MFAIWAFLLLGIERFLYGYIYHFPSSFKDLCNGPLKFLLDRSGGRYWEVAKNLGIYIKVFQFGVVLYDLLIRQGFTIGSPVCIVCGVALIGAGQLLNAATFSAIGSVGVYYGSQLGENVPWCSGFPYNMGIGDPQYWGVVLCVWGMYLATASSGNILDNHFIVAWLEFFWYGLSMKLLEDSTNGSKVLKAFGLKTA